MACWLLWCVSHRGPGERLSEGTSSEVVSWGLEDRVREGRVPVPLWRPQGTLPGVFLPSRAFRGKRGSPAPTQVHSAGGGEAEVEASASPGAHSARGALLGPRLPGSGQGKFNSLRGSAVPSQLGRADARGCPLVHTRPAAQGGDVLWVTLAGQGGGGLPIQVRSSQVHSCLSTLVFPTVKRIHVCMNLDTFDPPNCSLWVSLHTCSQCGMSLAFAGMWSYASVSLVWAGSDLFWIPRGGLTRDRPAGRPAPHGGLGVPVLCCAHPPRPYPRLLRSCGPPCCLGPAPPGVSAPLTPPVVLVRSPLPAGSAPTALPSGSRPGSCLLGPWHCDSCSLSGPASAFPGVK